MTQGFKVIDSKPIFKGHLISVFVDKIRTPEGQEYEREVVKHLDAVGIIALNDNKEVIFVKQYRHAIESDLLEIPAGLIEDLEDAEACAIRELKEETGYRATKIEKLAEFYTSAGFTDEKFFLFFTDQVEEGEPEREAGEEGMELVTMPLKEALKMAQSGEIQDAKTLTAVVMAAQKLGRLEL